MALFGFFITLMAVLFTSGFDVFLIYSFYELEIIKQYVFIPVMIASLSAGIIFIIGSFKALRKQEAARIFLFISIILYLTRLGMLRIDIADKASMLLFNSRSIILYLVGFNVLRIDIASCGTMLILNIIMLICVHIEIKRQENALREAEERARNEPALLHFECPGCRRSAAISDCEGNSHTCTKCGTTLVVDGDGDLLDEEGYVIETW